VLFSQTRDRWRSTDTRSQPITPVSSQHLGIAAIYQQPALFPELSVTENIALGLAQGSLFRRAELAASRDALPGHYSRESVLASIPKALAGSLSMPEQQLVRNRAGLGAKARVMILDEPTASLTDREVESLFGVIRDLRSEGVGIIYISHRLHELFAIGDRVTVLCDGALSLRSKW
jgi:rhamnose transport system ATP-binding protein